MENRACREEEWRSDGMRVFFYVVLNERVVSYNSGRLGLYQDEMVNERLTGEESGVTNGYGLGNGVKYSR